MVLDVFKNDSKSKQGLTRSQSETKMTARILQLASIDSVLTLTSLGRAKLKRQTFGKFYLINPL